MSTSSKPCPNCVRLEAQVAALKARVDELERQLASARKDSSTSSKPPSSDIVKQPTPASDTDPTRRIGGQPGHPRHQRPLVPIEQLSSPPIEYHLHCCPDCGGSVLPQPDTPPIVVQHIELPEINFKIDEHRSFAAYCPTCKTVHHAPLPPEVQAGGLTGPRLCALIAYLKGACHASFSTIRKFLRDVAQVSISRGQLVKIINKVSEALDKPYQELLDDLPSQDILNIDETGHKQNKEQMWTWCFVASLYTLFVIDPRRSADVLIATLGEEFDGVIGCDCFSAYRRFRREFGIKLQFCLAHLIRDVKYLTTLSHPGDKAYGERLLAALKQLFRVIHAKDKLSASEFAKQLLAAKKEVLRVGRTPAGGPDSERMAKRFIKHGEGYFEFLLTPGLEPTNNAAEQAIRFVVIDRKVTQGTRSHSGNEWCERIWTVMATCAKQGVSVFAFLCEAVQASFSNAAAPTLLPGS